jgi:enoyl-CoA hydratase/carnithine racemase
MRIERDGDVAILHMEAGRANAMNAQSLDALSAMFRDLGDAKAAVIAGNDKIFSAGLDLPSIVDLERAPLTAFMQKFEAVMLQAFELPIPLVAAIGGHAIAGGAVLALQADVRIAVDREALRIGFNEAQLGMALPPVVVEPLRAQVPGPSLMRLVLTGELFGPHQALKLGFLHDVAPEGELMQRALERAKAFAALPSGGVRDIKSALRKPIADRIREMAGVANDRFADIWFAPDTQLVLRATVAKLKSKR